VEFASELVQLRYGVLTLFVILGALDEKTVTRSTSLDD
jgi:hypothetical protein